MGLVRRIATGRTPSHSRVIPLDAQSLWTFTSPAPARPARGARFAIETVMPHASARLLAVLALVLAASPATSDAAIVYTYDFPGNPGSGLAANQTNGQPWLGTFSDFTRTAGLTQMPGAPANSTFGTESWNLTGSIDTTQYEGFSITAGSGIHLNL